MVHVGPRLPYSMRAYVTSASDAVARTAPSTSKLSPASSSRVSGTVRSASTTVTAANGMLRKNAQRQLANWTSQPPTKGPMAAAMPPSPDQDPMALARSSCRIVASIIDRLPGVSSAPAAPWRTRARMSWPGFWANPQNADVTANPMTPMTKIFRRP